MESADVVEKKQIYFSGLKKKEPLVEKQRTWERTADQCVEGEPQDL